MRETFELSESISEVCRKLGFPINGYGMNKVKIIAKENNFDLKNYNKKYVYNLNPKKCLNCFKSINYKNRKNSYCSSSCMATKTNKGRKHSLESKNKRSSKMTGRILTEEHKKNIKINHVNRKPIIHNRNKICSICFKEFYDKGRDNTRTTCSLQCQTHKAINNRTYQNGKIKKIKYINKEQKEVWLDSTWELSVAKKLDLLNIKWERPSYLKWIDTKNIVHNYYSDFYLLDYDTYLDPKNPFCITKDKEKLEFFKNRINLVYGHIDYILEYIESLVK